MKAQNRRQIVVMWERGTAEPLFSSSPDVIIYFIIKNICNNICFSSAKDCTELNAKLNHDLNNVSQWLVKNKLQHHSTKTKLMYVGSNHNLAKIDNDFPVMINDQLIPRVHQFSRLKIVSNKIFDVNNQVISLPGTHRKFR